MKYGICLRCVLFHNVFMGVAVTTGGLTDWLVEMSVITIVDYTFNPLLWFTRQFSPQNICPGLESLQNPALTFLNDEIEATMSNQQSESLTYSTTSCVEVRDRSWCELLSLVFAKLILWLSNNKQYDCTFPSDVFRQHVAPSCRWDVGLVLFHWWILWICCLQVVIK